MKAKKNNSSSISLQERAIPLIGHSGCRVELIHSGKGSFVRKTSKSISYNERLQKQCEKQLNFEAQKFVKTPEILNQGINSENLFFMEMEYISGQTLVSYLKNQANINAKELAQRLFELMKVDTSEVDDKFSDCFNQKISELQSQVPERPIIREALSHLISFSWEPNLGGECHGDLTFENILIGNDGTLYLIDFLDSFCNSWMIDYSKLLQDLELHWSFRDHGVNPFIGIRLNAILQELQNLVKALNDGDIILRTGHHILLLNILRIFPYSKIEMMPYLEKLVEKTLRMIQHHELYVKGAI